MTPTLATGEDTGTELDALFGSNESLNESLAEGARYHFFEGRKRDKDGKWQGTGYFYWQIVYRDPVTGKRIRKGGKAFHTCPDEARKQQFLRNTGRHLESGTGRLVRLPKDTGKDKDRDAAGQTSPVAKSGIIDFPEQPAGRQAWIQ